MVIELADQEPALSGGLRSCFAVPDSRFGSDALVSDGKFGDVLTGVALYDVGGGADINEHDAEEVEDGVEVGNGIQADNDSSGALPAGSVALDGYEGTPRCAIATPRGAPRQAGFDFSSRVIAIIAPPTTAGMPPPGCTDAPTRQSQGRQGSLYEGWWNGPLCHGGRAAP